ncbi:MAG: glycosyltransferase [Vibrio sp.]|uniref:glycosyltransferase n=1 Tax=Vibrio sp. TaxID=678 RepID=UPI003A84C2A6
MKVAVLIATYQCDYFFVEQLQSIIKSDKNKFITDIIISDDSSDDSILFYLKDFSDNRIKIVSGPKMENAKFNFLASLIDIESDWVFFSDQDDIWHEDKVEEFSSVINKIKDEYEEDIPQIIFSDASLIDSKGNLISDSFFRYSRLSPDIFCNDDILFKNCVQGASLCVNKPLIKLLRRTLENKNIIDDIAMHDWWIAILTKYSGKAYFINKPLLFYRQHENNLVGAKKKSVFNYFFNIRRYYYSLKIIRKQYKVWCSVSKKIDVSFDKKSLSLSPIGQLKRLLSKFIR